MNNFFRSFTIFILIHLIHQSSFSDTRYHKIQNGVQIHTPGNIIQVQFYTNTIVRIQKWNESAKPDSASLIVIHKPNESLSVDIQDQANVLLLHTSDLNLTIVLNDGSIVFKKRNNLPLLREMGPATIESLNLKNERAYSIGQKFQLTESEGIYGLGQHQYGYMNYRGRTVKLVQTIRML
jgi:alpha-D-xyloside xylohydrolase